MGYHGVSYVKKIPMMCRLHGLKEISLCQYMTTLEPNKVGAGTFGHPVDLEHKVDFYQNQSVSFPWRSVHLYYAISPLPITEAYCWSILLYTLCTMRFFEGYCIRAKVSNWNLVGLLAPAVVHIALECVRWRGVATLGHLILEL